LHKSGDKNKSTQFRLISNLDSLRKLFEKVIQMKLETYGELDGEFQHGFKPKRSTVTAMLELQDHIASKLDDGLIVGMYLLDLSAALDLLRPEILKDTMSSIVDPSILKIVIDFLSGRNFQVEVKDTRSEKKVLLVGCVQGSILGPKLFTLYLRNLSKVLPNAFVTSYADDNYVCVADKDPDLVKNKLEITMSLHTRFLTDIAMVTNVSKTKLTYFSRKPGSFPLLSVKNQTVM